MGALRWRVAVGALRWRVAGALPHAQLYRLPIRECVLGGGSNPVGQVVARVYALTSKRVGRFSPDSDKLDRAFS